MRDGVWKRCGKASLLGGGEVGVNVVGRDDVGGEATDGCDGWTGFVVEGDGQGG